MRIVCPKCGQDWIHLVAHPNFEHPLYWCPEEETLWFTEENLFKEKQLFGVTFTNYLSYQDLVGDPTFWEQASDLGEFEKEAK